MNNPPVPQGALMPQPPLPTIKPRARIMGDERTKVRDRVARRYERGASIRALAEETGRSYGFVHRLLSESSVTLRGRGGRSQVRDPVRVQEAALHAAEVAR